MRTQQGAAVFKLLAALIIVVVAALGAYLFLGGNQSQKPNKFLVNSTKKDLVVTDQSPSFNIKELGVNIRLPEILKGMSYTVSSPQVKTAAGIPSNDLTFVRLHMDSYTQVANSCFNQPKSKVQSFATLTKNNGIPDPANRSKVIKQLDGFYILNNGASIDSRAVCANKSVQKQLNEINSDLNTALKNAFEAGKEIKS